RSSLTTCTSFGIAERFRPSCSSAAARSQVQVRAAVRTESSAVLATMWRDGKLEQQRLASLLAQVELPPIVELHVAVGFEVFLELARCSPSVGDHRQSDIERQVERLETTYAFQSGGGPDPASHRDQV